MSWKDYVKSRKTKKDEEGQWLRWDDYASSGVERRKKLGISGDPNEEKIQRFRELTKEKYTEEEEAKTPESTFKGIQNPLSNHYVGQLNEDKYNIPLPRYNKDGIKDLDSGIENKFSNHYMGKKAPIVNRTQSNPNVSKVVKGFGGLYLNDLLQGIKPAKEKDYKGINKALSIIHQDIASGSGLSQEDFDQIRTLNNVAQELKGREDDQLQETIEKIENINTLINNPTIDQYKPDSIHQLKKEAARVGGLVESTALGMAEGLGAKALTRLMFDSTQEEIESIFKDRANVDDDIFNSVARTAGSFAGSIMQIIALTSTGNALGLNAIGKTIATRALPKSAGWLASSMGATRTFAGAVSGGVRAYGEGGDHDEVIKEGLKSAAFFAVGGAAGDIATSEATKLLRPIMQNSPEYARLWNASIQGIRGIAAGTTGAAAQAGVSYAAGDDIPPIEELIKTGITLGVANAIMGFMSTPPSSQFQSVEGGAEGFNKGELQKQGYQEFKQGSGIWVRTNPDTGLHEMQREVVNVGGENVYKQEIWSTERSIGRDLTQEEIVKAKTGPNFLKTLRGSEEVSQEPIIRDERPKELGAQGTIVDPATGIAQQQDFQVDEPEEFQIDEPKVVKRGTVKRPKVTIIDEDNNIETEVYKNNQSTFEAMKDNPHLEGLEVEIQNNEPVFYTRRDFENGRIKGYNEEDYDRWAKDEEYEIEKDGQWGIEFDRTGQQINNNTGGKIIFNSGATKDTILEEVVHNVQGKIATINPQLAERISDWEGAVRAKGNEMGVKVPEGKELLAKAFVFSEMGYADDPAYSEMAELYSVPEDIREGLEELVGASEEGINNISYWKGRAEPRTPRDKRKLNVTEEEIAQEREAKQQERQKTEDVSTQQKEVPESIPEIAQPELTQTTIQAEPTIEKKTQRKAGIAKDNDGKAIEFNYEVVSAEDLISSHTTGLVVNKDYPKELQPRDRGKAGYEIQVNDIANNLQPEFLGENPKISEGAPIVGSDNVVESGNGRVIALSRVHQSNPANKEKYIKWLTDNAEQFGIDKNNLPENPVLIRRRTSDVDRVEFVKKANESSVVSMSATETARSDSEKLTTGILNLFVANDNAKINTAENKGFINNFIGKVVPMNEQNQYMDKSGQLTQDGLLRVRNALFYKAYNHPQLMDKLAESLDMSAKNAVNTLLNIAPKIAEISEKIANGSLHDIDFSNDIAEAANIFIALKEAGQDVEAYLVQKSMFDDDSTKLIKDLVDVFNKNTRSTRAMTEVFSTMLDIIERLGDPNQVSLFGDTELPDKITVLEQSLRRVENDNKQTSLFSSEPEETGETPRSIKQTTQLEGKSEEKPAETKQEVGKPKEFPEEIKEFKKVFKEINKEEKFFQLKPKDKKDRDLIALHNVAKYKLDKAIDFGAIPAPSVAITRHGIPYTNFGGITMVGSKTLVDPSDSRNKVFSSDVYSPRQPSPSYSTDKKEIIKVADKLEGSLEITEDNRYAVESYLDRSDKESALSSLGYTRGVMYQYLVEQGKKPKIPMRSVRLTNGWINTPTIKKYLKGMYADNITEEDIRTTLVPLFEEAINEYWAGFIERSKDSDNIFARRLRDETIERITADTMSFGDVLNIQRDLRALAGGDKEVDIYTLKDNMNATIERMGEDKYKEWLEDLTKDVFSKPYLEKGRRKLPYNLDTVTDMMIGATVGQESGLTFSLGKAKSYAAKRLDTIEKIHKEKGSLATKEMVENFKDKFDINYGDVRDEVIPYNEYPDSISVYDYFNEAIADYFKGGKGFNRMESALKKNGFHDVPNELIGKMVDIAHDLKNAPVEYFEAKPQRVVRFKEFKAALIPKGTPRAFENKMRAAGINKIYRYEQGNEDSWLAEMEKAQKQPDVSFQLRPIKRSEVVKEKTSDFQLKPLKADEVETGKRVSIAYMKNLESAPYMGEMFGQNIEPAGEYMNQQDVEMTLPNYEYGEISFNNPLVVEHETTGQNGWKGKLSKEYEGKTKEDLTNAIKEDGYDSIITIDSEDNSLMEVVNLSGEKASYQIKPAESTKQIKRAIKVSDHLKYLNTRATEAGFLNVIEAKEVLDTQFDYPTWKKAYRKSEDKYNELSVANGRLRDSVKTQLKADIDDFITSTDQLLSKDEKALQRKITSLENNLIKANQKVKDVRAKEKAMKWEKVEEIKQYNKMKAVKQKERKIRSNAERGLLESLKKLNKEKKYLRPQYESAAEELLSIYDHTARSITKGKQLSLENSAKFFEKAQKEDPNYEVPEKLKVQIERLSKKHIKNLSDTELQQVQDMVDHIVHVNSMHNMLIKVGKARKMSAVKEDIIKAVGVGKGIDTDSDFIDLTAEEKQGSVIANFGYNLLHTGSLRPETQTLRLLGWDKENLGYQYLYTDLNEGNHKAMGYMQHSTDFLSGAMEGIDTSDVKSRKAASKLERVAKKLEGETIEIKANGKVIKITKAHRIGLYLHTLNKDNLKHILNGGIRIRKGETSFRLTQDVLDGIVENITMEEMIVADAFKEYYNGMQKDAINEVSLDLYGYHIARVNNYFQIITDFKYREKDFLKGAKATTLEGMGFTKERVGGENPIILESVFETFERNSKQVSSYYGLARPLKNAKRLMGNPEIRNAIEHNFNRLDVKYYDDLIRQLDGEVQEFTEIERMANLIINNVQVAILGLNPLVAAKQVGSYITTMARLAPKYLASGFARPADWGIILKYSPVMWLRRQGYVTREAGEIADRKKNKQKKGEWSTAGIRIMDYTTVGKIWNAVEDETKATKPELKVGSDEFYEAVAKRHTYLVEDTQPSFPATQRPSSTRKRDPFHRAATMFTTQLFQQYNLAYEAFATKNPRLLASVLLSTLLITVMGSLAGMWRGYKDSLGEDFWRDFALNTAGHVLYVNNLSSHLINGYRNESITDAAINDIIAAIRKLNDPGTTTPAGVVKQLAETIGQVTGQPIKNVTKEIEAMLKNTNPELYYEYLRLFSESSTKTKQVLKSTYIEDYLETGEISQELLKEAQSEDVNMSAQTITNTIDKMNEEGADITESQAKALVEPFRKKTSKVPLYYTEKAKYEALEKAGISREEADEAHEKVKSLDKEEKIIVAKGLLGGRSWTFLKTMYPNYKWDK